MKKLFFISYSILLRIFAIIFVRDELIKDEMLYIADLVRNKMEEEDNYWTNQDIEAAKHRIKERKRDLKNLNGLLCRLDNYWNDYYYEDSCFDKIKHFLRSLKENAQVFLIIVMICIIGVAVAIAVGYIFLKTNGLI